MCLGLAALWFGLTTSSPFADDLPQRNWHPAIFHYRDSAWFGAGGSMPSGTCEKFQLKTLYLHLLLVDLGSQIFELILNGRIRSEILPQEAAKAASLFQSTCLGFALI